MNAKDAIVWPLDAEGCLVNLARTRRLQPEYEESVAAVLRALPGALGAPPRSVYLRGSIALGKGTPPYSDLDLIVVVEGEAGPEPLEMRRDLLEAYPILEDIDVGVLAASDVGQSAFGIKAASYMAVEARLIAGEEQPAGRTRIRPDKDLAASRFPDIDRETAWLATLVAGRDGAASFRGVTRPPHFWARWSMRLVLRASQMLAMLDTGQYSNDLHSCFLLASSHFPRWRGRLVSCFAAERDPLGHSTAAADVLSWWREEGLPKWRERVGAA